MSLFIVTAGNPFVTAKTPLWVYHTSGTINSVSVDENGSYIAVGVGFNRTSGAVLLLDGAGDLLWEHPTSRIIGEVSISGNGSRIEANGYQLSSGLAGDYENDKVYALDSKGNELWNRTASVPWSAAMSSNGSTITIVGMSSVALLTWEGEVLWNYTAAGYPLKNSSAPEGRFTGPPTYFVSQNGTRVAVGANGITRLGSDGNSILVNDGFPAYAESQVVLPNGTSVEARSPSSAINNTALLLTGTFDSVIAESASSDGAFSAAALGLSGQGGTGYSSTLYFFKTAGNGSLLQGLEDKLTAYTESSSFILFAIGSGITMVALFVLIVVIFTRGSLRHVGSLVHIESSVAQLARIEWSFPPMP